jgi:hypothetical protein
MSFPIRPENGKLIVRPLKKKNLEKIGSIYVGQMADLDFGEVLAAHADTKYQEGEIIGFPSKSGLGQIVNGEICLWLQMGEIWGVWDKTEWEKLSSENE